MTLGDLITSVIHHSASLMEADLPVLIATGFPGSPVFPVALLPSVLPVHVACSNFLSFPTRVFRLSFEHTAFENMSTSSKGETSV